MTFISQRIQCIHGTQVDTTIDITKTKLQLIYELYIHIHSFIYVNVLYLYVQFKLYNAAYNSVPR